MQIDRCSSTAFTYLPEIIDKLGKLKMVESYKFADIIPFLLTSFHNIIE
jgi:hypothetical protein